MTIGRSAIGRSPIGRSSSDGGALYLVLGSNAATAAQGALSMSRLSVLPGQPIAASQGTFEVTRTTTLSGLQLNASLGTLSYSDGGTLVITLTGQALGAQQGEFGQIQRTTTIAGQVVTGQQGTLTYSTDTSLFIYLTGQSVQALAGQLSASHVATLSSITIGGEQGTLGYQGPRTHVRTQIRAALASLLNGLTTTGNRVFTSRPQARPLHENELPAILIYTDDEIIEPQTIDVPAIEGRGLEIHIDFVAAATDSLDSMLDAILAEVEVAINTSHETNTLNGVLKSNQLASIEVQTDADSEIPVGRMMTVWQAQYMTMSNAPGVAI